MARPALDVEVWELAAGEYEFLAALSEGETVAAAIQRASASEAEFNAATAWVTLIHANIVVAIEPADASRSADRPWPDFRKAS